jgi:hypothetical protein
MPTKTITAPEHEIAYSRVETSMGKGYTVRLFFDAARENPYTLKVLEWSQWDGQANHTFYYSAETYQQLLDTHLNNDWFFRDGATVESEFPMREMIEYLHENNLIPEWVGKELIFDECTDNREPYSKAKLIS